MGLFYDCKSLKKIPDISKWNTSKVLNISFLFFGCSSLVSLPDISKWNVNNICFMNCLFSKCSSLISLPDLSKWNIFKFDINNYISYLELKNHFENIKFVSQDTENMFSFNKSYNNDLYIENITYQITSLKSHNKEEFIKAINNSAYNVDNLFTGCSSLKYLPNISKWNIEKS